MEVIQNQIKYLVYCIMLGAGLVFYAHANFATKESVNRIEGYQTDKDGLIIKRLDRIEDKLDKINTRRQ